MAALLTSVIGWLLTSPAGQALGGWFVKTFEDEVAALVKAHQQKQAADGLATAFDDLGKATTAGEKANAAQELAGAIAAGPKRP